jgi:hypothetical protein
MDISKVFFLIGSCALFLWCTPFVRAQEETLKITEMAVTTKIVKGNPIDAVRRISSTSVKALYCFTRIVNPGGDEGEIKHVWYRDGKPVSEQVLKVRGEKWRTWSKRPVDRESAGDWRVDVLDREGKLLKSVKFRIN